MTSRPLGGSGREISEHAQPLGPQILGRVHVAVLAAIATGVVLEVIPNEIHCAGMRCAGGSVQQEGRWVMPILG